MCLPDVRAISRLSVGALYEDVNELRKREKTRDLVPLSALESVAVFQQNQFIHSLIERTYTRPPSVAAHSGVAWNVDIV